MHCGDSERPECKVTIKNLSGLLAGFISETINSGENMKHYNILMKGRPGIGKSAATMQAVELAEEMTGENIRYYPIHLVVKQPPDMAGLGGFDIDDDGKKFARFFPYADLKYLVDAKEWTVVDITEIGQSSRIVQAAIMPMLWDREINGHRISDKIIFLSSTNRTTDNAGVTQILRPLVGRFTLVLDIEANVQDLIEYGRAKNWRDEVLIFLKKYGEPYVSGNYEGSQDVLSNAIEATPTSRNIEGLNNTLDVLDRIEETLGSEYRAKIELATHVGAVGFHMGVDFNGFLKYWRELPDWDEMIRYPDTVELPGIYNGSALYATAGMLIAHVDEESIDAAMTIVNRLPKDYGGFIVSEIQDREKFKRKNGTLKDDECSLLSNASLIAWCAENNYILTGQD